MSGLGDLVYHKRKDLDKWEGPGKVNGKENKQTLGGWLFNFFNWDSLHARLSNHYEACSYKKGSTKKITRYKKSV